MAEATVAILYTLVLRWDEREPAFAQRPDAAKYAIRELARRYSASDVYFAGVADPGAQPVTTLNLVAHEQLDVRSGWESLDSAVQAATKQVREPLTYAGAVDPVPRAVLAALRDTPARAQIVVPVRAEDVDVLTSFAEGARLLVSAAIRHAFPQLRDQDQRIAEVQVTGLADDARIRLEGDSAVIVREVAEAYLSPAWRRATRPRSLHRPVPVWAWCSAATGLTTFVLSFLPLTVASLIGLGIAGCAGVTSAAVLAPRFGASRRASAGGVAPVVLLIGFAILFGALGLGDHELVRTADGEPLAQLRDPLLLSLSLMATVGVLDLKLSGVARSFAYLEMLIVLGAVGGAGLIALRRVSTRLEEAVRDIRRDQG